MMLSSTQSSGDDYSDDIMNDSMTGAAEIRKKGQRDHYLEENEGIAENSTGHEKSNSTTTSRGDYRSVLISRILFGIVFLSSAIAVAFVVHHFVSTTETAELESRYWSHAEKMTISIGDAIRTTMAAADSLSTSIVSHKEEAQIMAMLDSTKKNATFPFVALPKFPLQAAKSMALQKSFGYYSVEYLVEEDQRKDWEAFAATNDQFVAEAWELQRQDPSFQLGPLLDEEFPEIRPEIFSSVPNLTVLPQGSGPYLVSWQKYPVIYDPYSGPYNYDLLSNEPLAKSRRPVIENKLPFLAGFNTLVDDDENPAEPMIQIIYPILDNTTTSLQLSLDEIRKDSTKLVGMISYGFFWRDVLKDILPPTEADEEESILVVTETSCGQVFTYQINAKTPIYLGNRDYSKDAGDQSRYPHLESKFDLADILQESFQSPYYHGIPYLDSDCPISVRIYPSQASGDSTTATTITTSQLPLVMAIGSVLIFVFCGLLFVTYDILVTRRQFKATAANKVRRSRLLFDSNNRKEHEENECCHKEGRSDSKRTWASSSSNTFRRGSSSQQQQAPSSSNFLSAEYTTRDGEDERGASKTITDADGGSPVIAPVAELYSDATILYASVVGFAEWSVTRDSREACQLLEKLFLAFDALVEEYQGIYKVESGLDSYVAASGVPNPQDDHAVCMARFATACRDKGAAILHDFGVAENSSFCLDNTNNTTNVTSSSSSCPPLYLRFGLHSGPVMGTVLRGHRSRFQLFGDTAYTAAKIDRTGEPGRIQASKATADLLCIANKDNWVQKRPDIVHTEGKREMELFWIDAKSADDTISTLSSIGASISSPNIPASGEVPPARVLSWSVECLEGLLKKVLAKRGSSTSTGFQLQTVLEDESGEMDRTEKSSDDDTFMEFDDTSSMMEDDGYHSEHEIIFESDDEETDDEETEDQSDPQGHIGETTSSILITEDVSQEVSLVPALRNQLAGYIHALHVFFEDHEFHNFEHAFHVAIAMDRLLSRIEFELDPLAQFAAILSALISDVGHPGVPNQSIKVGKITFDDGYKGKSVTQHFAFEIAWKLYLEPSFSEFRKALTPTKEDLARFRKLLLGCVNATDIMNPSLSAARKRRWQKAFGTTNSGQSSDTTASKGLATTAVLEHCMLASYMYHTMQKWDIYQDWNERHFNEMCAASGRGQLCTDPTQSWYLNELSLFDKVVIPLAEQLYKVFNVDSDLLKYARRNRSFWEKRGELKVEEMKLKLMVHANQGCFVKLRVKPPSRAMGKCTKN